MKQFKIVACLLLVGLAVITSCNDSSLIGSDIISDDQVNVEVRQLSVKATTVLADSLQTYRTTSQLDDYICGFMEDPIFGKYESVFNTQLRLSRFLTLQDSLDIKNIGTSSTLDSAFLVLELADEFYGQINDDQEVEVYLLDNAMDNNTTYYSSRSFLGTELLGSKLFTPSDPDSAVFFINNQGTPEPDTIKPPQMQISLDIEHPIFRDLLFGGESALQYYQDDAALLGVFNGLQIRVPNESTGSTPNDGLMIFDPLPASPTLPSVTGLYVYYTSFTGDSRLYTFTINDDAAKMVNFIPDHSGSPVEPFIGENEYNLGDSLIFVQGMSGLNAKLEIQDFSSLQNVIINKAEIEFTIASDLPEESTLFSSDPIQQLLIATKNTDGELERITDIEAAIAGGQIGIFGGQPVEDSTVTKYKMNITAYLQELVNGEHDNAEIYLYPALRTERPQRVVLFGPGHSEHPVKIYVTYTENQ